ncbi:MAG: hypothetical protein RLY69_603 [Verrucomicrobiota bacterium]
MWHFRLAARGKLLNPPRAMHRHLPLCLSVLLLIAFRVIGAAYPMALPNFQPLAALFFCGSLIYPGWRGFALPVAIWIATFPLGSGHPSGPSLFLTTLGALSLTFLLGKWLSQKGWAAMLLGSVGATLVFHLITNSAAWLADPRYAKSLVGLWQSLWTGAPGDVLPSWVFLRNLGVANLLFTGAHLLAMLRVPSIYPSTATSLTAKSH